MKTNTFALLNKLRQSFPWLARYPLWRMREMADRRNAQQHDAPAHIIFVIANHFEPSWSEDGISLSLAEQMRKVEDWSERARRFGRLVVDSDGTPFRHTYFFPGEEYHPSLVTPLAELQAEGYGEVEVHLHHGVERPDNALNLRRALEDFRDALVAEHRCLAREDGAGPPRYAFVHGNWALANSAGGKFCGVDSEMQILAETGCYVDLTLPSAPDQSQVPHINAIYQCGRPLAERSPHRTGRNLKVGDSAPPQPVLLTGPLTLDWSRPLYGLPVPRIDNGALTANYPPDMRRLDRWRQAHIAIEGRPEWIFIKLHCHGFLAGDDAMLLGEPMHRFLDEVMEQSVRSKMFRVHFATAREAFNIVMAAVDGHHGDPAAYRDYRMRLIMNEAVGKKYGGATLAKRV